MGQGEVLKLLKKKNEWIDTKTLSNRLKVSEGTTSTSLNKLYKNKEVKRRKVLRKRGNYINWIYEWKNK